MKVQMIAPTPFFAHRGCHVRILEEIRALQSRGHEVVLCTYGLGDDVPAVRVERARGVPWYQKLTAGPSWHKLYLDVLLLATARRVARTFQPDVLHAHLHEGAFLASIVATRRRRTPILADFQGSLTTEMEDHGFFRFWPWGKRFFERLENRINRRPEEIVVSSRQAMPPIVASRDGREASVSFLVDGVDAEIFRPDEEVRATVRRKLGLEADDLVVGYLGLLTRYQGVDCLLEAAPDVVRKVPEARFLVMGFPNEEEYRAKALELGVGDRVIFTGRIPYAEAPEYLAAVDVAVSAKLSLTEANGKLLNYMASGLPTVVFESGLNREILGNDGIFARYGDARDLAESLIGILRDPSARSRLKTSLRRRAIDEFSWDARARQFEEIYERLIAGQRAPSVAGVIHPTEQAEGAEDSHG